VWRCHEHTTAQEIVGEHGIHHFFSTNVGVNRCAFGILRIIARLARRRRGKSPGVGKISAFPTSHDKIISLMLRPSHARASDPINLPIPHHQIGTDGVAKPDMNYLQMFPGWGCLT